MKRAQGSYFLPRNLSLTNVHFYYFSNDKGSEWRDGDNGILSANLSQKWQNAIFASLNLCISINKGLYSSRHDAIQSNSFLPSINQLQRFFCIRYKTYQRKKSINLCCEDSQKSRKVVLAANPIQADTFV